VSTPHPFGPPMPDEYLLAHYRKIHDRNRQRMLRSRLRARTGLSSLRPRRETRRWSLISFLKGN
jgi:hypothetical protein